jgi:hypothetical protein
VPWPLSEAAPALFSLLPKPSRHFERSEPTFFLPIRSCESVGLRREKSLFLFPNPSRQEFFLFSNFSFPFSKDGRNLPTASFASAPSAPPHSIAPRGTATADNPSPAAPPSANCIPNTRTPNCGSHCPSPDTRHHMVEAPHRRTHPAQAVKATPALPRVDRQPQRPGSHEIRFLNVPRARHTHCGGARREPTRMQCTNLLRQEYLHDVTHLAAFCQPQRAFANQAVHRSPCRPEGKARAASEPRNRKAKLRSPLQPAVPQQMRIHRPVVHREPQPRYHQVSHLFPHPCRIDLFVFHILRSGGSSDPCFLSSSRARSPRHWFWGPSFSSPLKYPDFLRKCVATSDQGEGPCRNCAPKKKTPRP